MKEILRPGYRLLDRAVEAILPKTKYYRRFGRSFQNMVEKYHLPNLYKRMRMHPESVDYMKNKIDNDGPKEYFDVMGQLALIDLDLMGKNVDLEAEESYNTAFRNALDFFILKLMGDATKEVNKTWTNWAAARIGRTPKNHSKESDLCHALHDYVFAWNDGRELKETVNSIAKWRIKYNDPDIPDSSRINFAKEYGKECGKLMNNHLQNHPLPPWGRQFLIEQGATAKMYDDKVDFRQDARYKKSTTPITLRKEVWKGVWNTQKQIGNLDGKKKFFSFLVGGQLYNWRKNLGIE